MSDDDRLPGNLITGEAQAQARPVLVLAVSWEAVLGQALADAVAHRTPAADCPACDASLAALCEDHAVGLDSTDAYLGLAWALGIEVER
jgi:hypothetical protein